MAKYMNIRNSLTGEVRKILISRSDDKPAPRPPADDATKADLVDWLASHGVEVPTKANKAELWELVRDYADQG